MSAENAINSNDASNAEESVQNTEAPKRSGRKLKLLCNPAKTSGADNPKADQENSDERIEADYP